MRDIHFLELAKQAGVDINKEIHLLFAIEEFVRQKERHKDPWGFRIKADGGKYWVNHKEMIASFTYPYMNELLLAIENHKKMFKMDGLSVCLKDFNPLHVLTELSSQPDVIKNGRVRSIRVKYCYLVNGDISSYAIYKYES